MGNWIKRNFFFFFFGIFAFVGTMLGLVAGAENAKAALGLPDMFQALRAAIHAATGLG